jgi:outer membrane protein OmpA-like peptidoglycan-associated protein
MAKKKTVDSNLLLAQRSLGVGLLAAACLLASPRPAAADGDLAPKKNTISIGVTAGIFLPDSDVHDFYYTTNTWQPLKSAGPALGARLSYEPIRYAGVELEGEMIPIGTDTTNDTATILGWRAQVIGEVPARVTPFALIGGGTMGIISGDSVLGDETDFVWHMGLGAKFYINQRMSVRLDGRWLVAPKRDLFAMDDSTVSHFLITTSLAWRFEPARPLVESSFEPAHDVVADRCAPQDGVVADGCPGADTDRDGIDDASDRCPSEAETINEVDDDDGCPDREPDQDADGIADRRDTCPDAGEDMDSFQDTDGCPDPDNDNDGIADGKDGCAQVAGPVDNQGCPDKDGDGDGLADRLDNCPSEPGFGQFRGCRTKQLVVISQTDIKVQESIYFASSKASIRSRSNSLLDNLALVLNSHPEIARVTVEGHTDDRGDAARNKALSQSRAQSVVDYLISRGVSPDRLEAIGHGEESPIAENRSSSGRSQNRRVEFRIERKPVTAP